MIEFTVDDTHTLQFDAAGKIGDPSSTVMRVSFIERLEAGGDLKFWAKLDREQIAELNDYLAEILKLGT